MRLHVPDSGLAAVFGLLERGGHRARLVGGAVRDILRGEAPKDMDVATDALPENVVSLASSAGFRVIETGLKHGTVTVMANGVPYEVTTLRRDAETDGRHAKVEYVSDFRTDAARRDFTINAMSAAPDGEVFDYFGGADDLSAGVVRFVGDADERIAEDYLRILRFFRFRARFGAPGEEGDLAAAARGRHGLARISPERIWSEVAKIVTLPAGMAQIEAMQATGVTEAIGLAFDRASLAVAGRAARAGGRAGTVLGTLVAGRAAAERLALEWRLSNSEAMDIAVAAAVASDPSISPGYWIGMATDGVSADRLVPALEATGRLEAAKALREPVPVFPLRGKDLIEAGFEAGPAVGAALAAARRDWKDSGFKATRDDLMASLAPNGRTP